MPQNDHYTIAVYDNNSIHQEAFRTAASNIAGIEVLSCKPDQALPVRPGLIMLNMEHVSRCPNLLMLNFLKGYPGIPVVGYSAGRWSDIGMLRQWREHVTFLTYDELACCFAKVVGKIAAGLPFYSELPVPSIDEGGDAVVAKIQRLSPREKEILCLLGKGHGTSEISHILKSMPETVKTHLKNLRRKLELLGTVEARYLALAYAQTRRCRVFFKGQGHICPCTGASVGRCAFTASCDP